MPSQTLVVGLGCALGGIARYWISSFCQGQGMALIGTLLVNVLGCFGAGIVVSLLQCWLQPYQEFGRLFLIVGFLGGLTTFSAFSLDVLQLGRDMQIMAALSVVILTVLLSLFATVCGFLATNQVCAQLIKI